MTKEDNIIVPRWFLENVENTLRIQNNINLDKKTGETCQDRNIKESLNGVRKLLKGEELTGRERFEKLQPSIPSDLDEAARSIRDELYLKEGKRDAYGNPYFLPETLMKAVEAGAGWMAGQGETVEGYIAGTNEVAAILAIPRKEHNKGDKVIVQIRKK